MGKAVRERWTGMGGEGGEIGCRDDHGNIDLVVKDVCKKPHSPNTLNNLRFPDQPNGLLGAVNRFR